MILWSRNTGPPSIPDDRVSRGPRRVTSGPRSLLSARRVPVTLLAVSKHASSAGAYYPRSTDLSSLFPHPHTLASDPHVQPIYGYQFRGTCSMSLDLASHVIAPSTSPHDSHATFGIKTHPFRWGLDPSNAGVKCCKRRMFSPSLLGLFVYYGTVTVWVAFK
jgi:hypothetical protein